MTAIKNIFAKPVDRPIEGVIKADDEASLLLEMKEYVLTNEVIKSLGHFLEAYNNYKNYKGKNGVWISGFFGSGKSHLLKILTLLLENRQIENENALDLFLDKCGDEEFLQAEIRRACSIPSKSILFNIDQKADVISKTQTDALLSVFVKIFDETRGYYGKQGYVARFERDLDSRGIYGRFRECYKTVSGRTWEKGREQTLLESENIARAYCEATGSSEASTSAILDKYRDEYSVSIEDFAEDVRDYIETRGGDFRVNFLVDEVGQYVAGNIKLMTNLQTIAESLATKCEGRAWIIVTAQEDMETVLGESGQQGGNDFSKIQDRFANRMKLTSADVAEVIRRRLLEKNKEGMELLSDIYDAQRNNFKTLFDFVDGAKTYKNFSDTDHFASTYPFIPYQFDLFQSAIQSLSKHDAFEGKHSSVGERSMLGVFRQVVMEIGEQETGELATFDLMFEGIRASLKSSIQQAVIQAERQLDNSLAVRLLKALFLVKYVKDFRATTRNLAVLVLDSFTRDIAGLREEVKNALDLLEKQIFIERDGELYQYLTDREKDVEREIKNTEVDDADIVYELQDIVFNEVISPKIRCNISAKQVHDYPFSKKIDGRLHGKDQELSINVISPLYGEEERETAIRAESLSRPCDLFVVMSPDEQILRDMWTYKKTEKYIRQNTTMQESEIADILAEKGRRNRERQKRLRERVKDVLGRSKLLISAKEIEPGSDDPRKRIEEGFNILIQSTYTNLKMLGDATYYEREIEDCFEQRWLIDEDDFSFSESEQEMFSFIQANKGGNIRTSVKRLVENFERAPYGWPENASLCVLAGLCGRGRVEAWSDGNLLDRGEIVKSLKNANSRGNVLLEPQTEFTQKQFRDLKDFHEDFFSRPSDAKEAKALAEETAEAFRKLADDLALLKRDIARYPFCNVLDPAIEELRRMEGKPYTWYLSGLPDHKDRIAEIKEKVINPLSEFMKGQRKNIFDDAMEFVRDHKHNLEYIETEEKRQVLEALDNPESFRGNAMREVKTCIESLRGKIGTRIDEERGKSRDILFRLRDSLLGTDQFALLGGKQQEEIRKRFEDVLASVEKRNQISMIREETRSFEETGFGELLSRIDEWIQSSLGKDEYRKTEYISLREIEISFEKLLLEDEADVDAYLQSMKDALLGEISKGKRIRR